MKTTTIKTGNFKRILEQHMPGSHFSYKFHNENKKELHIRGSIITSDCMRRLILEAERQQLDSYITSGRYTMIRRSYVSFNVIVP